MPLAFAPFNKELTVRRVGVEEKTRKHLQEMGIMEGSRLTVISSTGGNVIIVVMEGRVCLDRQLASKIMVA